MTDTLVNSKSSWFKVQDEEARVVCQDSRVAQVYLYLKSYAQRIEPKDVFYYSKRTSSNIVVHLEVGEAIFSRSSIANATGLSEQNVRTALKNLEKLGILTSKSTNQYTKVLFLNSDSYKNKKDEPIQQDNQHPTNTQPTHNQHPTTNQEDRGKDDRRIESEVATAPTPTPTPPKKSTRFVRPSVEEVATYCRERNNLVDPQRFVDYYESNGWKVGKNSMKDWKACVRTWEKKDEFKAQAQIPTTNKTQQPSLFDAPQPQAEQAYTPWHEIMDKMVKYGPDRFKDARFNDITKQAILTIGGWRFLCSRTDKELTFKAIEYNKIARGA